MKKTQADPTGQSRNRTKGTIALTKRLVRAERSIKSLLRSIPRTAKREAQIQNAKRTTLYDWEYDAQTQGQLEQSTEFIIDEQLLETHDGVMPFEWYWKSNIELPYRQGTVEELRDFNQLVSGAVVAGVLVQGSPPQTVPIENVLLSETYRARLEIVKVSNFSSIKTLSDRTASQVLQQINAGIQSKLSSAAISKAITERFNVAKASAKRISDTEINKAYTDSRMATTDQISAQTGLRAGVIHKSALTPTTRTHHADRHGNAYTTADQTKWWDSGSNRINCKCSIESILIDKSGNVINVEHQENVKAIGKEFFKKAA